MSACRFQQRTECTGPGSMEFSLCQDCRGPVDLSKDGKREPQPTKPAAPEMREEVKTMPTNKKPTPATCPECKRPEQILYACKYHPEAKTCSRCAAKFTARAKAAEKTGQQSATKAHDAAKAKGAGASKAEKVIAQQRPARDVSESLKKIGGDLGRAAVEVILGKGPRPAPSAAFVPLTARALADALTSEVVTLQVTCRTVAAILAVVRAVECDGDVMIAAGKGRG